MEFDTRDQELQCTESTLLYHLMSGLHTSINTHISANFHHNEETIKNSTYFMERIGGHPDRVRNLHFIYGAAVRAVSLISEAMERQDYTTGIDSAKDAKTYDLVKQLINAVKT